MNSRPVKVLYSIGHNYERKAPHFVGYLRFYADGLQIEGDKKVDIQFSAIQKVSDEFIRNRGLVVKIGLVSENVYISSLRFILFNKFAILNYFKTVSLSKEIMQGSRGHIGKNF